MLTDSFDRLLASIIIEKMSFYFQKHSWMAAKRMPLSEQKRFPAAIGWINDVRAGLKGTRHSDLELINVNMVNFY